MGFEKAKKRLFSLVPWFWSSLCQIEHMIIAQNDAELEI